MSHAQSRIGVLAGGVAGKRDVSLRSAEAILGALKERGCEAVPLFVDRDIDMLLRQSQIGVAFVALQGRYGEDGCIQGLLEVLGVPYTGSGVLASALAMNRAKSREVFRLNNVPTAPFYVHDADLDEDVLEAHGNFGFPVLVRPATSRSRLGTTLVTDELDLEPAVDEALRFGDQVVVERHLGGREICVGVLDGEPLGALEVHRGGGPTGTWGRAPKVTCSAPARLSPERYRSILRLGAQVYEALGCEGPACVDLIVSDRGNEVVLDVDTMPVLTPGGVLPRIARGAGLPFPDLVLRVLEGARLKAHGRRSNRRVVQAPYEGPERRAGFAPSAH